MPRSFALGEHFDELIDRRVRSGRYNNASEVVRAALRLLEDEETAREISDDEVRRLIAEARERGGETPLEEARERVRAKILAVR
jgi:antitoxin ParD1/3/4